MPLISFYLCAQIHPEWMFWNSVSGIEALLFTSNKNVKGTEEHVFEKQFSCIFECGLLVSSSILLSAYC